MLVQTGDPTGTGEGKQALVANILYRLLPLCVLPILCFLKFLILLACALRSTGGESIYGEPFKDEIHGRIRFNKYVFPVLQLYRPLL